MDRFTQMHNDYLDPDRYFGDQEQPIQLHDDGTLKGYGRRQHGLNGKDADLDPGGQNVVDEAWWFADGTIRIHGTRYADICPPSCAQDDEADECWDVAHELVSGCDYVGEWSDDYWYLGEKYALTVNCDWDDDQTEAENIARASAVALEAISKDSTKFENEMSYISKAMDDLERLHGKRMKQQGAK